MHQPITLDDLRQYSLSGKQFHAKLGGRRYRGTIFHIFMDAIAIEIAPAHLERYNPEKHTWEPIKATTLEFTLSHMVEGPDGNIAINGLELIIFCHERRERSHPTVVSSMWVNIQDL